MFFRRLRELDIKSTYYAPKQRCKRCGADTSYYSGCSSYCINCQEKKQEEERNKNK